MRVVVSVAGGHGHLYPLVPLAWELSARGHEVGVAVPRYFAHEVESLGLRAHPLDADGVEAPSSGYKAEQARRAPYERGRGAIGRYLEQSVAQAPALLELARELRPDVFLRDTTAFASWLVGERLGIPVAVLDHSGTPLRLLAASVGDLYADARRHLDLPPDPTLATLNAWLHLLAAPPGWYPDAAFGPTTHLLAPPPDMPAEPLARPDGGSRPFVYATLGTIHNDTPGILELMIDVLGSLPVDALVTTGPDVDPASLGTPPDGVRVERFVPQAAVLPLADLVISHCGYSSVMSPLAAGIPLVVVPLATGDSAAVAARVRRFGAGEVLGERDWTVAELRDAVVRALGDGSRRAAARELARQMEALPTFRSGAGLVERLGRTGRPVPGSGPVSSA